jgi:hypothetical protein
MYPYTVEVSMPVTTTLTSTAELQATMFLAASKTMPDLSSTPFAKICVPNSKKSAEPGAPPPDVNVAVVGAANLTEIVLALRLQIDTVTTANVLDGTVYTTVFVVADKLLVPKIPVAML